MVSSIHMYMLMDGADFNAEFSNNNIALYRGPYGISALMSTTCLQ